MRTQLRATGMLRSLTVLTLAALCCGCSFTRNLHTVLIEEPLHFPTNLDHIRTKHTNKRLARASLAYRIGSEDPWGSWWSLAPIMAPHHGLPVSPDYADGYCEGFTDYLTYGGAGLPPLAPPRRYWRVRYANSLGREAIHTWYVGFSDGAADAMQTGYREARLVPVSIEAGVGMLQRDGPPRPSFEEEIPPPADPTMDPMDDAELLPPMEFGLQDPSGVVPGAATNQPEPTLAVRPTSAADVKEQPKQVSATLTAGPASPLTSRRLPAIKEPVHIETVAPAPRPAALVELAAGKVANDPRITVPPTKQPPPDQRSSSRRKRTNVE